MVHDTAGTDSEEPSTNNARVLRTDGGSEADQETPEADEESEATSETESGSQSESPSESESESDSGSESTNENEEVQEQEEQEADDSETQEETPAEPAGIEADDEAVAEQTGDVGVEPQPDAETDAEGAAKDESTPSLDGEGDTASIIEVRNQVIELSTDVIGRSLDGIVEISRNDDAWRAVVEIIERRSVPDTQDILGQYEIELDDDGEVIGYRRLEKYRRADTGPSQR